MAVNGTATAAAWGALHRAYHLVNYEWADTRTQHLPLVQRPFSVLALMLCYVGLVTSVGPSLMRRRQPLQLRGLIAAYDALQVLANAYLCYLGFGKFWLNHYNWRCEPIDRSNSPEALEMARLVNYYFWLKIIDLLDTVFFVLRKKNNQITFLHVYHHSMMIFLSWQGIKYFPGGHATLLGFVNSFVHAVMYLYYLVSALYPHTIWWKKYVTQLQLLQHVSVGLHEAQLLLHNPCGFPMYPPLMLVPQAALITTLFLRFYRRAYCSAPTPAPAPATAPAPAPAPHANGHLKKH